MIVKKLSNCVRCQQDHLDIEFKKFDHPVEPVGSLVWDYWATCPTTREPILMRKTEDDS